MSDPASIQVWVNKGNSEVKAALPSLANVIDSSVEVSAEALAKNLQRFLSHFNEVLDADSFVDSSFSVSTIELNLAVNSQGGVELIGKLSTGVQASMKVVLRKQEPSAKQE